MDRGLRALAGQPVRPYNQVAYNQGSDVYLTLTFLDRKNALVIPKMFTYRIDNLTTDTLIKDYVTVIPIAAKYTIDIPGSVNIISPTTGIGNSSQLNQVLVTCTYVDNSTATAVFIYEVIALQTVGGA